MRNMTKFELFLGAVFTIACCGGAIAQNGTPPSTGQAAVSPEEVKFFRLDFVVKEIEQGKVITSRSYSTMASTKSASDSGSIRAGSRIPILVALPGGPEPGGGQNVPLQYIDVGVNIDCNHVHMKGDELVAMVNADISTLAEDPRPQMAPGKDQPTKTGPGPGFAGPPDAPEGDLPPEKDAGPSTHQRVIRTQVFRGPAAAPVIRQNRWSATAVVPLGKPLTLFSSDDITSKRRMEVEMTATEIR
jgi:hypothetical protein